MAIGSISGFDTRLPQAFQRLRLLSTMRTKATNAAKAIAGTELSTLSGTNQPTTLSMANFELPNGSAGRWVPSKVPDAGRLWNNAQAASGAADNPNAEASANPRRSEDLQTAKLRTTPLKISADPAYLRRLATVAIIISAHQSPRALDFA